LIRFLFPGTHRLRRARAKSRGASNCGRDPLLALLSSEASSEAMFDLCKLQRQRRRTVNFYDLAVADCKADKNKNEASLRSLYAEASHEIEMVDNSLNAIESDRLVNEAREFDVETPAISDEDGLWEKDWYRGRHFLSAKGRRAIRTLVDEEKARRFEVKTRWVTKLILPLIIAFGALIGAATGFVLALKR
jgi:hypothetical protein